MTKLLAMKRMILTLFGLIPCLVFAQDDIKFSFTANMVCSVPEPGDECKFGGMDAFKPYVFSFDGKHVTCGMQGSKPEVDTDVMEVIFVGEDIPKKYVCYALKYQEEDKDRLIFFNLKPNVQPWECLEVDIPDYDEDNNLKTYWKYF